jgi:hypothetical protein
MGCPGTAGARLRVSVGASAVSKVRTLRLVTIKDRNTDASWVEPLTRNFVETGVPFGLA